ncbi:MAG TPA: hypothetical protein VFV19_13560 [Candidatus Polarisedimenticolaceae bacterium]|nr:hypothetical protein [Candidatus Polarisedimenticolaceae bacterium]
MEPMSGKKGSLGRAGNAMDEFIGDVREQARSVKEQYIDKGWAQTRNYARENPGKTILLSAGIGAGVGLLLGAMMARRRY